MAQTPITNGMTGLAARTAINGDIAALYALALGGSTNLFYDTTMTTGGTATANGAALRADIIAANGKAVVIPTGTYNFGGGSVGTAAVDLTSSDVASVYLWFLPRAKLVCNTAGKNSTNIFFAFRDNIVAEVNGGEFDGGTIAEMCIRTSDNVTAPGSELTVRNAKIYNFGWNTSDSATAAVAGTVGILCSNGARMVVDNCQFRDCRSKANGTAGDQPGKICFIQWLNSATSGNPFKYSITNCEFDAGVGTNEADDHDCIHILQQYPNANAAGVIADCRFKFNGKSRRILKFQGGGVHKVTHCHASPNPYWALATTGVTSITVSAATAAAPGAFTAVAHGVPTGTYVKLSNMAGGTWGTVNDVEYIMVPITDADTFNLYGPGADLDTSALGVYSFVALNPGNVRRTNGQGNAFAISAATAASPGVFTTRYGAVTAPHGFVTGEMVRLGNLSGGTWSTLNDIDYYVVVLSTTTFSLKSPSLLDTSGLGLYTGSSGTIARVNGCTERGLNGVDWAGGNDGLLEIENCHFDFSGFSNGIVQSIGVGGTIHCRNSVIIGNRYDANRNYPDTGTPLVNSTVGWSTGGLDAESSLVNCDVYGWGTACIIGGVNSKVVNNRFIDPRTLWVQNYSTVVRDGLVLTDNEVITRTPYSLNSSANPGTADFARCGTIRNWTNVKVNRNRLSRLGNTLHGTRFIAFITNGVTGEALDNTAPAPCLPISYSAGVAQINNIACTSSAGAVTQSTPRARITTESLTTAAGATYVLTVTNTLVVATDTVKVEIVGGTNSAGTPIKLSVIPATGSFAIRVYNAHAAAAFNGTLIMTFELCKG